MQEVSPILLRILESEKCHAFVN